MTRTLHARQLTKYFVSVYEDPNSDDVDKQPKWIQDIHYAVRRIAIRLKGIDGVTPLDARNYFEGAATLLTVAVEQLRQVKNMR